MDSVRSGFRQWRVDALASRRFALAIVVTLLAAVAPAHALATTTGSVTMVSQSGDYIGVGQDLTFDSGTFGLSGTPSTSVQVTTPTVGTLSSDYTLDFAAPSGQPLHDGEYDNATRYPFQASGVPGVSVYGDGRGCNNNYGRFVINDIGVDSGGNVDRFWALYEQHCEAADAPALFGEVRLNEPPTGSLETVAPSAIDWPDTPIGTTGTYVPVQVKAGSGGASIASVALSGPNASDFTVGTDGCTGTTLAAGGSCDVDVAAAPNDYGDLSASLTITDSIGSMTTVPLALVAQPAVTGLSPAAGVAAGNTTVTIQGSEFVGVTGVMFGSQPAVSYVVDSPAEITAVSPSGTLGSSVDVTVTGAHGTSGTSTADEFLYANPPDPPQNVTATAGVGQATVSFVPPTNDGGSPITAYTVTASPGGAQATGSGSPITVTGLSPAVSYTFSVTAGNAVGQSPAAVSNAVTTLKPTTTTITPSKTTSYYGTPLQFNATVGSAEPGVPTGTVSFSSGGGFLGQASLGPNGQTIDGPSGVVDVGGTVTASYSGDSAFAPSDATFEPNITPDSTAVALATSANPAQPNSDVTLTATVSDKTASVIPTGTVQFFVNGTAALPPQQLDTQGRTALTAELPAGSYNIGAAFRNGAPDFNDSQTVTVESVGVQPSGTTPPTPPTTTPAAPTAPTAPTAPAPLVLVGSASVSRTGTIRLHADSTSAGTFKVTADVSHGAGPHRFGQTRRFTRGRGSVAIAVSPTAAAENALANDRHLTVKLVITFTPADGAKGWSTTRKLTVTYRKSSN